MRAATTDSRVRGIYSVTDMIHEDGDAVKELVEHIRASCGEKLVLGTQIPASNAADGARNVVVSTFHALSTEKGARYEGLADHGMLS